MNKRILIGTVLTLITLMTIAVPALATKPTYVSGSLWWAGPPGIPVFRPAGKNCIIDVDVPYEFDGNLKGEATLHFTVVSHGLCPAGPFDYNENLKAQGTFFGTVNDKEGTFDLKFVGKGWPAKPGELALTAKIVVLSGTGELANLHGVLDVSYIMGDAADSYSGQIHFDPQP